MNQPIGPLKGVFIAPPEIEDQDERADALPEQEAFWHPPVRFGSVPVEKEPLGWDRHRGFRKLFPRVGLPFQVVDLVPFGHPELEPNRLFWGDNLHVMRQLPSESIDLIYIDPPFFSGRQYNVIFGDQNELRSFSDIWEGGMPGYLIWLNARLFEMKRLLKKTGSIFVHCDWHASHYVRGEMDKIFGHEQFRNEVVWRRGKGATRTASVQFPRNHDSIIWYSKSDIWDYHRIFKPYAEKTLSMYKYDDNDGRGAYRRQELRTYGRNTIARFRSEGKIATSGTGREYLKQYLSDKYGVAVDSIWEDIGGMAHGANKEKIGYPTQKPEALIERIIEACSKQGAIVADFFSGGGTTAAVVSRLGRRWIACDQSRVAVAVAADRLVRQVEERMGKVFAAPDFTVEHWDVYEAQWLSETPPDQFRSFVLKCFGAVMENNEKGIHGYKGAVPIWVGEPGQSKAATAEDVRKFANAVRKTLRYKQDNLRDGFMLAWAFRPDAVEAAERLRRQEQTDLNFIRLDMIRIDSLRFREHVAALSTEHADYENFLTFVQPPKVEVGFKRIASRDYKFDVSETAVLNAGAKIINVQWDFDYGERFSSTPGYSFSGSGKKPVSFQVRYRFPSPGTRRIACKVQDDKGGEGFWTDEIEVQ